MPNQNQYNTTLQRVRQIDCKIAVLDEDYTLIDEISGITTNITLNVNADSDIRRTAEIDINLKDDVSKAQNSAYYWTAGNAYWFDKYVQIYTAIKDISSDEYVWVNQGIYCVNAPSIDYDATNNTLSFQAVDLVAKMTGMRNGQLQGSTTSVLADTSIKNIIEDILLEQGFTEYIIYDPPQERTVEDINIDAGGTAWDLLTQLRDINSNWEMFFDVDGVFHFQEIPSGKVITDATASSEENDIVTDDSEVLITDDDEDLITLEYTEVEYTYGEPVPLVDDTIWDKVLISASYDTNFQDVKNYVEVYGKAHESSEVATAVQPSYVNYLNVTLTKDRENYLNGSWTIAFGLGDVDDADQELLAYPIYYIYVYDASNSSTPWLTISCVSDPIVATNEMYCFKITVGTVVNDISGYYMGYLQPMAYAFENNPESPFYVGQLKSYTCDLSTSVDFANENETTITDVDASVVNYVAVIDIRPWISADDYSAASLYDEWYFRIHVELDGDTPITQMIVYVAGTTIQTGIYGTSGQQISLDYSQDYMLVVARNSTDTPSLGMLYYPTDASLLSMSGSTQLNMPQFNNQVRMVCAGGEYDNIYTNDLARQRARYEIYLRARLHDTIDITCVPIYWLDVNQIISYRLPNSTSIEDDYWLVKSITTDVSVDGQQQINATRYYPEYAQI